MGEAESQLYSPASARKTARCRKKNRVEIKKSIRTQINRLWKKMHILYEEEVFAAYPEDKVTPDVKRYEGFTSPAAQTVAVDGNGNTVIEYKYARNIHKLKLVDRGSMKII